MTKSATRPDCDRGRRPWIRLTHRWLGLTAAVFVILLSVTGIALNHSGDWQLDRRFVSWKWLLDTYGIQAPAPTISFADDDRRATLLGAHIYVDGRELPRLADSLTGLVSIGSLVIATTQTEVMVVTGDGELVQYIDLASELPGSIERLGRVDDRPVIGSGGELLVGDADVTAFGPWHGADPGTIAWSVPSTAPATDVERIQEAYRGRGVTVERVLADIHSGRIVSLVGPALLDVIGIGLVLLSVSGLFVWFQRRKQTNGEE